MGLPLQQKHRHVECHVQDERVGLEQLLPLRLGGLRGELRFNMDYHREPNDGRNGHLDDPQAHSNRVLIP